MKLKLTALAVPTALFCALALPAAPSMAQAATTHTWRAQASVPGRLRNQQARIDQGVHSGALTHREDAQVQRRDNAIRRTAQFDRRHDYRTHGVLTSAQRRHLNRRLNQTSTAIYRDKHNHRVAG